MSTLNGVPRLTSRQIEVVELIADDLSASEIAERLGISRKTVEFHRALIKERLGVTGTAGIIRYAVRTGLLQLTPSQGLAGDYRASTTAPEPLGPSFVMVNHARTTASAAYRPRVLRPEIL